MTDFLEYPNLLQEVRGAMHPGRLKLQGKNLMFKNIKTGKVDHFNGGDVDKVNWLVRSRGYCLKVMLKNGSIHRFDGFKEEDYEKLSQFVQRHYSQELEKQDVSTKGWNWGTANFIGNSLTFDVGNKLAFEVPLSNVSASTTNKNEVTLEFHQNDDAAVSLMEMRFHIPTDASNTENDPVLEFHKNVLAKADIIQATGESIALFPEAQCLTPRGRYDLKIYPTFLQLHGKTYDYKIPYTTVLRLFLLPHKDNRQMFFVVSLDPPIKQGQTRYPFVILLYNKEDETTVELTLSEEDIQEKFEGKLAKEMSGPEYEIISRIMKAFVNRKITVPGTFKSFSGGHCITCSYKASNGFLYPLERGFLYVHKPPVHIRFDECSSVNFARGATTTRSFDFEVETKSGNVYTFSSIEKDEYGKLYDFVKNKHLRVKNIGGKLDQPKYDDMVDSDDDETHDAYLERMKQEGKERDEDDDEDEDESADEDFKPAESGSDVAEEYDSEAGNYSSDESGEGGEGGGDDEAGEKKKKKKEHKTKTVRERAPKKESSRKKKAKKDPNMPKRPMTGYMLWLNDNRERIKKENPGISVTEVSKIAGEQWKTFDGKAKYEAMFAKAKQDYDVAMKEYKANLKETSDTDSPKKAKKKKAPSSAETLSKSKPGSGGDFKSKEFISSSESSGDEDTKPKKAKKKKEESDVEMESEEEKKSESEASASEDDKPLKKKEKPKGKKAGKTEQVDELPSDEEILSSPEASDSESGSDSGEDSGDDD